MMNPLSWIYNNAYLRFKQDTAYLQMKLDVGRHQRNEANYNLADHVDAVVDEVIKDLDWGKRFGKVWFEDSKKAFIKQMVLDRVDAQKLARDVDAARLDYNRGQVDRALTLLKDNEGYQGAIELTPDQWAKLNLETTRKLANIGRQFQFAVSIASASPEIR